MEATSPTHHLCLVTETFPPEINGVSMTLGRLVEEWSKRGIFVTVVAPQRKDRCGTQSEAYRLVEVAGCPIPRYPDLRFGLPCRRRLSRLWKADRPDVVHIATEGPLGWSALRAAKLRCIPVVSSYHTNFHSYGSHYGYGALKTLVLNFLRHFHNSTALTFVPSIDSTQTLEKAGFLNLRLLERGVDVQLFRPDRRSDALRRSWGVSDSERVALYVGRLAGEKNLPLLIEAYRTMRRRLPGLRLVLVGDGPDRRRIQRKCPEAIITGMQRAEALSTHYACGDCFLFPSLTETFGNVVPEAMASGLPILAFDYAAPRRFVQHGISGHLAPFGQLDTFIEEAKRLTEKSTQWSHMGKIARSTVMPHSWASVCDDYLQENFLKLESLRG